MPDQEKPASGELIVAMTEDGQNVVINHPDLLPDAEGCGHIVFSPAQARNLAWMLFLKANIVEGLICANCNNPITQEGGWATAIFRYCFKEECQQEFYKEAQAMIRKVDPHTAELLAEATKVLSERQAPSFLLCPTCGTVSYNPNDITNLYCGRCHIFLGDKA